MLRVEEGSINYLFCLHDSTFEGLARSVSVRRFHYALWRWTFEAAFADTDLNADHWIIRSSDNGIGGLQRSPKGAVHRESNPSTVPADVIVVRAGSGESTFNVGGPPSP